jgi:hypothetical protein
VYRSTLEEELGYGAGSGSLPPLDHGTKGSNESKQPDVDSEGIGGGGRKGGGAGGGGGTDGGGGGGDELKQMLKTPKSSVYDFSSYLNTHKKLLENIVEASMKSDQSPVDGSGKQKTSSSKLMESVIKPTLTEIKSRIDSGEYTKPAAVSIASQQEPSNRAANVQAQREADIKKQQLENVWLLLATGFTALETILNSSTSVASASTNSLAATIASQESPFRTIRDGRQDFAEEQKCGANETTAAVAAPPKANILLDFASMITSFTMEELDGTYRND